MWNPSMSAPGGLAIPHRPDAALRRRAVALGVALALLALAGVIGSMIPSAPASLAPVLVGCSDGTCAVPSTDGRVRTVIVRWVHPAPAPAEDDPGAGL